MNLNCISRVIKISMAGILGMKTSPHPGGGTLVISGWGCAAGTLEPLAYTRASSAEFCYPILEFLKSLLS